MGWFIGIYRTLPLLQDYSSNQVKLLKLDDNILPSIDYSVVIDKTFHVTAFRVNYQVTIRYLIPTFSYTLNRYSQLNSIIQRLTETPLDLKSEIKYASNFIKELSKENVFAGNSKQEKTISFLCNQLNYFDSKIKEYNVDQIKDDVSIYLRSRSAYRELRKVLNLPCQNTLKSYFGALSSPGSMS